MIRELTHSEAKHALAICDLGLKNQRLLSGCLDHGLLHEATQLRQIDRELSWMLLQVKRLGNSTHYIWRTQDDDRVRPPHAANDDKVFSWDKPPTTGHPGEDYNCRCWAGSIPLDLYEFTFIITKCLGHFHSLQITVPIILLWPG